ncbi:signal peptide peptidase SppA [Moraxella haemolytica]|uniref:signal peptide peptidase SppA n=1 Tax=Moraxella haemolytica TaxID=2904119 RepID=UPI0025435C9B|nr:signal peptide peptidase SppA [Moraxella sp. ZY171148]WII94744.1 signal peptide peptidase SppA [Moraxella sp. ZY171148]
MVWPPNPHQSPSSSANTPKSSPTSPEWQLIEKTMMAGIEEQKRARRWSIFFKLLTFAYVVFFVLFLGRGCTTTNTKAGVPMGIGEPHLAVVDVQGAIMPNSETSAHHINAALQEAFENTNAKAVALAINSPGGSPVQSDEVWQMAMELKAEYPDKKLYAIIGDTGASGAYYIASAADEIWVNPSSLVGSIGVIMSGYNIERLLDKAGIADRTLTAGEYKDILSMSRPMNEIERTHVQSLLNDTHQNFIEAVKKGRGDRLKNPEQNQIFTGLFWTGKQSVELGLADKIGGMSQLEKQLKLESVNYSYIDPVKQFFDRFGVQMGKGLGQGIKIGILGQDAQLQ